MKASDTVLIRSPRWQDGLLPLELQLILSCARTKVDSVAYRPRYPQSTPFYRWFEDCWDEFKPSCSCFMRAGTLRDTPVPVDPRIGGLSLLSGFGTVSGGGLVWGRTRRPGC